MGLLEQKQEVDPKNQEQFDILVANGMSIIHNQKTSKNLINQIVKGTDPVKSVADATLGVMKKLQDTAMANKIQLDDGVFAHGANMLMGEIIGIAEAAGMKPMTDEQKQQSYSLAVAKYLDGEVKSGRITPEQLSQMSAEVSKTQGGQEITKQLQGAGQPTQGAPGGQQGQVQPTQGQVNPDMVQ